MKQAARWWPIIIPRRGRLSEVSLFNSVLGRIDLIKNTRLDRGRRRPALRKPFASIPSCYNGSIASTLLAILLISEWDIYAVAVLVVEPS
jgi:hypothetical protein